jgi:hypothetical protein
MAGACGLEAAPVHEEVSMPARLYLAEHTDIRVYNIHEICVTGVQLPGVI